MIWIILFPFLRVYDFCLFLPLEWSHFFQKISFGNTKISQSWMLYMLQFFLPDGLFRKNRISRLTVSNSGFGVTAFCPFCAKLPLPSKRFNTLRVDGQGEFDLDAEIFKNGRQRPTGAPNTSETISIQINKLHLPPRVPALDWKTPVESHSAADCDVGLRVHQTQSSYRSHRSRSSTLSNRYRKLRQLIVFSPNLAVLGAEVFKFLNFVFEFSGSNLAGRGAPRPLSEHSK